MAAIDDAVQAALVVRDVRSTAQEVEKAMSRLSGRERQILELLMEGLCNKEMAAKLDLSEKTISTHRKHIFTKMGVGHFADLVRKVDRLHTIREWHIKLN